MKIYLPKRAGYGIGGCWSFVRNLTKALAKEVGFTNVLENCDVYFIPGPTIAQRDEVRKAKEMGKKVVLRVDGVPEDWRNRNTGWSRLKDYAKLADQVIYQSEFIKRTVGKLVKRDGVVIYNGVDKSIFKPKGAKYPKKGDPSILHVGFRKDPNKRPEEVIMRFRELKTQNSKAFLLFAGNFPTYLKQYKFGMLDFVRGKDWDYVGIITDRNELAKIMRSHDYLAYVAFGDPCPNVLIEGLSCGLKVLWLNNYGGQKEIVDNWEKVDWSINRMGNDYLSIFKKVL